MAGLSSGPILREVGDRCIEEVVSKNIYHIWRCADCTVSSRNLIECPCAHLVSGDLLRDVDTDRDILGEVVAP
jgi:hypothetical protein